MKPSTIAILAVAVVGAGLAWYVTRSRAVAAVKPAPAAPAAGANTSSPWPDVVETGLEVIGGIFNSRSAKVVRSSTPGDYSTL